MAHSGALKLLVLFTLLLAASFLLQARNIGSSQKRRATIETTLKPLVAAIDSYVSDNSAFLPRSLGLEALIVNPKHKRYIVEIRPDAWGSAIRLHFEGSWRMPMLQSAGKDTVCNTSDDIKVFAGGPTTEAIWRTHEKFAEVALALAKYNHDCGQYPQAYAGLDALNSNPGIAGWSGPYMQGPNLDSWGTPLFYRLKDLRPIILSAGPDKTWGTMDDLSSDLNFTP